MGGGGLLVGTLEVVGTVAFALSGAVLGVRRGMDLFGVLVLALVTATAGGVVRDVLIGAVPPASVRDWHAAAQAVSAGLFAFCFPGLIERVRSPVQLSDAAGLGVFAATGAQKALDHGIPPVTAAVLGMVTGIGGGIVRDVLVARVPVVLQADIYAVAALAGAAVVAVGLPTGVPEGVTVMAGAAFCFFLRTMAIYAGWNLPLGRRGDEDGGR